MIVPPWLAGAVRTSPWPHLHAVVAGLSLHDPDAANLAEVHRSFPSALRLDSIDAVADSAVKLAIVASPCWTATSRFS